MVSVAVAVPPTEGGLTTTVAVVDAAAEHTPLVTCARKYVVAAKEPVSKVDPVCPGRSVNVVSSVEDRH
jgi:hypothetical protein